MLVARQYVSGGRVQRVGFRDFTATAAVREGVAGWVRNLPDGRVEIVAEGATGAVERFERDIRQGPRGARVDDVQVTETLRSGRHAGFTIR